MFCTQFAGVVGASGRAYFNFLVDINKTILSFLVSGSEFPSPRHRDALFCRYFKVTFLVLSICNSRRYYTADR